MSAVNMIAKNTRLLNITETGGEKLNQLVNMGGSSRWFILHAFLRDNHLTLRSYDGGTDEASKTFRFTAFGGRRFVGSMSEAVNY